MAYGTPTGFSEQTLMCILQIPVAPKYIFLKIPIEFSMRTANIFALFFNLLRPKYCTDQYSKLYYNESSNP